MRDLELNQPTIVGIRDISRIIIWNPRETSLFPFLPRVPRFSFNDRAVLVRNAYGLRAISSGTTCGQKGVGGANNVPLLDNRESAVLSIFCEILTNGMNFHSKCWDSGQVGMSKVLSHDGDRILV